MEKPDLWVIEKYGAEKTGRARECAALVYEDGDSRLVERFILLEDRYGRERIRRAFEKIGAKHPSNPRRTAGYFLRMVESPDWGP